MEAIMLQKVSANDGLLYSSYQKSPLERFGEAKVKRELNRTKSRDGSAVSSLEERDTIRLALLWQRCHWEKADGSA
ncbi:hypothetical protein M513_11848 [Trichuris suis]|uniref:Uncharacterized protein n=1 Tax=Trichuris suis TaxID=68888 RepID=A0A085LQ62_9BILA|nr:hypothetical protein M513_12018 [Trichuris suis]KFD47248.1 hypothetical protein M513_11848 [Trichuris suis]